MADTYPSPLSNAQMLAFYEAVRFTDARARARAEATKKFELLTRSVPTVTPYGASSKDYSGIQPHSAGSHYPCVVVARGWADGPLQWEVIRPDGTTHQQPRGSSAAEAYAVAEHFADLHRRGIRA